MKSVDSRQYTSFLVGLLLCTLLVDDLRLCTFRLSLIVNNTFAFTALKITMMYQHLGPGQ